MLFKKVDGTDERLCTNGGMPLLICLIYKMWKLNGSLMDANKSSQLNKLPFYCLIILPINLAAAPKKIIAAINLTEMPKNKTNAVLKEIDV